MPYSKSADALTIREIEYSIRIKDKDKGFHELHNLLSAELTRFEDSRSKSEKLENPIRNFLQINIERSIVIRDSTRVYFLNYKEHGSLTIQFKLLIVCRYVNFGSTRQALDYLIKDTICEYFEELLERHLPVSSSVQTSDNELYAISDKQPDNEVLKKQNRRDYLPVLLASIALLLSLSVLALWVFQQFHSPELQNPAFDFKDKYYELLIEKKVSEAIETERNTHNMEEDQTAIDSAKNSKSDNLKQ